MASRDYCTNVSQELEIWSEKLHELSDKIDNLSTGEKQKLFPNLEGLHILLAEMDDRLCDLLTACPLAEGFLTEVEDRNVSRLTGQVIANAPRNRDQDFDYEFGG